MLARAKLVVAVGAIAVLAAGCGSSSATAQERIDGCLKKQPDATESDCKKWEKDGQLGDDGAHQGHQG